MNQLEQLQKLLEKKQLEPYIRHIRFPKYKNLQPYSQIDFTFPLSVIVGPNGTNKSSIIKALAGAPLGESLGKYWFSTKLDDIPVTKSRSEQARIIYGYYSEYAKKVVEVIKARVSRFGSKDEKSEENSIDKSKNIYDPDYWEPTRPYKSDGMEPMPAIPEKADDNHKEYRSTTRWNQIKKDVVYLDFRSELSAFDKYFYFMDTDTKSNNSSRSGRFDKRTPIKRGAITLAEVIENRLNSFTRRNRQHVFENREMTQEELKAVCFILERKYKSIIIVKHSFFLPSSSHKFISPGYSIYIQHNNLRYSEAFAGSGEFSVAMLVTKVLNAPEKSLILLDEPEVSIHPAAQSRLIEFLLDQIKCKKHQIVISTHSPAIIRDLPSSAIKVLHLDEASGETIIKQNVMPEEAFYHIGEPVLGKIQIIVEDKLARLIVRRASRSLDDSIKNMFDVVFFSGGAESITQYYIATQVNLKNYNTYVFLDGDQKNYGEEIFTIDLETNNSLDFLKNCVRTFAKGTKIFRDDIDFYKNYIKWVQTHVFYLPGGLPEDFIWTKMEHDDMSKAAEKSGANAKEWFKEYTKLLLSIEPIEIESQHIFSLQSLKLAKLSDNCEEFNEIRQYLINIVTRYSQTSRLG
jgi:predicted ATPase